jgi:hypothetical protein
MIALTNGIVHVSQWASSSMMFLRRRSKIPELGRTYMSTIEHPGWTDPANRGQLID